VTGDADIELIVRIVLRVLRELDAAGGTAGALASAPASAGSGPPLRCATERDVLEAVDAGVLRLAPGAVVTPLARETAEAKGVELVVG
jgi:hypothetical protein